MEEPRSSFEGENIRTKADVMNAGYVVKLKVLECSYFVQRNNILQEFNHLSYKCPKNQLGDREPPPKKKKHRKTKPFHASTR